MSNHFMSTSNTRSFRIPFLGWRVFTRDPCTHDMSGLSPDVCALTIVCSDGRPIRVPCAVAVEEKEGKVHAVVVAAFADVATALLRLMYKPKENDESWRKLL